MTMASMASMAFMASMASMASIATNEDCNFETRRQDNKTTAEKHGPMRLRSVKTPQQVPGEVLLIDN